MKIIRDNSVLKENCYLVGTDYFASSVGLYWVDSGYLLPDILNPKVIGKVWIDKLIDIINKEKIDVVIPGLDLEFFSSSEDLVPISVIGDTEKAKERGVDFVVIMAMKITIY